MCKHSSRARWLTMESIDTQSVEKFLQPYLPAPLTDRQGQPKVFVTATWAQSLDARIAAEPGQRTQLSGMYTKKMTHFLRKHHDAILVGKNTVIADDPSLNCRYAPGCSSPRPIILDSNFKFPLDEKEWKVLKNAEKGQYPGPWIVVDRDVDAELEAKIRKYDGDVIRVQNTRNWHQICQALSRRGVQSLMVEGGAAVLDTCLVSGVVNSIIITLAPVFLGRHGVEVTPQKELRPRDIQWWSQSNVPDSVYAAKVNV